LFDTPSSHQYRLEGFDWVDPGNGLTLTWSVATLNLSTAPWQASFTGQLTANEVADVQRAFATWSSVANVHFSQVTDSANVGIRIGIGAVSATEGASAVGVTFSNPTSTDRMTGEQIEFDQGFLSQPSFNDENVYVLALHEIGHALGLDHSTNSNAIMAPSNFFESASLHTQLSADDIAGIQAIFGAAGAAPSAIIGTLDTQGVVAINGSVSGDIALPAETQFYKVTLAAGQTYSFDMRSNASRSGMLSDPDLSLADSTGRILMHASGNGTSGAQDAHIGSFVVSSAGTFYLETQAVLGDDTGSFTLSATGPAPTIAQSATPSAAPATIPAQESVLIEAGYYLSHNSDVAAAGINAAVHFTAIGWQEGRDPDALFDVNFYLSHNPDVAQAHIDPLLHYATFGWKEGRDPSASFSTSAYLAANPDVRLVGIDPLQHYLQFGISEGRSLSV
jgi:hypothetical protein